jgi:hypothetical protein
MATRKASRKGSRKASRKASRKLSKGASSWNKLVMKHFHDGRKKNKGYSLKDAIMSAKKEKDSRK